MKEYKVETLIYYSKLTFDVDHIVKNLKSKYKQNWMNIPPMDISWLLPMQPTLELLCIFICIFRKKIGLK